MEYDFRRIEQDWQQKWKAGNIYNVANDVARPKFYVLDMFPYPSGAGLHVGHPLGYIASDIFSRYKRLRGFNVLHPMGFDSFGLPAEQYALETGQHPAETTRKNIETFKAQLDKIGFCYDWNREVKTSDASYYRWTQWIFLKLFNSYFCNTDQKAKPIAELINKYATKGAMPKTGNPVEGIHFTAEEWNGFSRKEQEDILMKRRLCYSAYGEVNWCEALGTVLANDEVVNGVSERGGHPVVKKKMRQWYLRITAYADRLLEGLDRVAFSDSMKEMQKNWIGKSEGAELKFRIQGSEAEIDVYTTRPDTIFGADFLVLAPEHELVPQITSKTRQSAINEYLDYVKSRSDRERIAEVKQVTGCFTGAYAVNPFDGRQIPVWIAEYVLAGYGTGAIMAVPCGDQRDYLFAKHFNIPITNIIGNHYDGEEANPTKEAVLENSDFLNGMKMKDAISVAIEKIEALGIGKRKVNYRMRDAGFSRQRYWGEPFPVTWKDGIASVMDEKELPLQLPFVEKYGPGPEGEGPLANLADWINTPAGRRETSTMPGYAGSSWYFLRYMDPHNNEQFCSRQASDYWNQVDVYIGGTEHAVGHLLYSRMWTKFLFDLGLIGFDEPFKKLVNQGMIQGSSRFVYRVLWTGLGPSDKLEKDKIPVVFLSKDIVDKLDSGNPAAAGVIQAEILRILRERFPDVSGLHYDEVSYGGIHVDVNIVDGVMLNLAEYISRNAKYNTAWFITSKGTFSGKDIKAGKAAEEYNYTCGSEVEKMSKSKYNTVNPDDLVLKYGADTFRMYEMFLGPVEQSKPWDTKGIEGVHRFLRKLWRLFFDDMKGKLWNDDKAVNAELKVLHRTIRKIEEDTERFSFNTAVSTFMICINELSDLHCHKKEVLEKVLILIAPYAPHIAEELWNRLGNTGSVLDAAFPQYDGKYLVETAKDYPVSINGKLRSNLLLSLEATTEEVEKMVLANEVVQKWLEGKPPKKIIYVKNKMINVVI